MIHVSNHLSTIKKSLILLGFLCINIAIVVLDIHFNGDLYNRNVVIHSTIILLMAMIISTIIMIPQKQCQKTAILIMVNIFFFSVINYFSFFHLNFMPIFVVAIAISFWNYKKASGLKQFILLSHNTILCYTLNYSCGICLYVQKCNNDLEGAGVASIFFLFSLFPLLTIMSILLLTIADKRKNKIQEAI